MNYNTKNYTEQGGEVTHFGGKVIFDDGVQIVGLPQAANQAASTATDVTGLKNDLNTLIAAMKTAGLMAADTEE